MTLPSIYMYMKFFYILRCIYVDSKLILCFVHMKQEISQLYLLQVITPNNLNKVSLTLACLFITTYIMKLKVLMCIMKFKKILINFLLEKSFYSVQEFMTIDP